MQWRDALPWQRKERGWWETIDADGSRWRAVRSAPRRWEVYRGSELMTDWPESLDDAKYAVWCYVKDDGAQEQ